MKIFIKNNWWKLSIVGLIVLAIFIGYMSFQQKRADEKMRYAAQELKAMQAKNEKAIQEKQEYVNKRKMECYDIYNKEKSNWNNTQSPDYDEIADICRVVYKDGKNPNGQSKEMCKSKYDFSSMDIDSYFGSFVLRQYAHCVDGTFEKEF